MVPVRKRLWVPNQFPGARTPGELLPVPAIAVGPNLLLVRHSRMPPELAALAMRDLESVDPRDLPTGPTYTAEPIGKRPVRDREATQCPFEFDKWAPAVGFLRFVPKRKVAAHWSLSLRSQMDLPWAMVSAGEGDLAMLLEAARELVQTEHHAFPPVLVDTATPNICPAADLEHVPQTEALAAVEGLIAKSVNRP